MGITKPCTHLTQLHPPPPSSFQPPLNFIHLHPAHFSLHPALCNTVNIIRTKIWHVKIQKIQRLKNSKLSVLPENWHSWYIGGADSESRLRILKLRPQNPFPGKFGLKKSKLSVLPENWHTWYLGRADSAPRLKFSKFQPQYPFWGRFGPKKSKLPILPKIDTQSISKILILIPTLIFLISNLKSIFR